MFGALKQLAILAMNSKKYWLLPAILALIIVGLLVVSASIAPVPIFLYPLI